MKVTDQGSGVVSRETLPEGVAVAHETLAEVLRHLGLECAPTTHGPDGDGAWTFRIEGAGAAIVIGRHGQTLEAIEYLLNRIAFARDPGAPRVTVDVEGYRERREEALIDMARRVASKVRSSGVSTTLSPMSPRDRRVVHMALADDAGVTTRSEGDGTYKRLVVLPQGARSRG